MEENVSSKTQYRGQPSSSGTAMRETTDNVLAASVAASQTATPTTTPARGVAPTAKVPSQNPSEAENSLMLQRHSPSRTRKSDGKTSMKGSDTISHINRLVASIEASLVARLRGWQRHRRYAFFVGSLVYHSYLVASIVLTWYETSGWCHGSRLLTLLTLLVYVALAARAVIPALLQRLSSQRPLGLEGPPGGSVLEKPVKAASRRPPGMLAALLFSVLITLLINSKGSMARLRSLAAACAIVALGYACSTDRSSVSWNEVAFCLVVHYGFTLFSLRWGLNEGVIGCFWAKVDLILRLANKGSSFIFGHLYNGLNMTAMLDPALAKAESGVVDVPPVNLFKKLPNVFIATSLVSVLYHVGAMQWLLGNAERKLTIAAHWFSSFELLIACNWIFFGPVESLYTLHPYLETIPASTLHSVLAMTVVHAVIPEQEFYAALGINVGNLTAASMANLPAALAISRLVYPCEHRALDTETPGFTGKYRNWLDAMCDGALNGMHLGCSVVGNLVSVLGATHMLNDLTAWLAENIDVSGISIQWILGRLLQPCAYAVGIPWKDSAFAGDMFAIKMLASSRKAYLQIAKQHDKTEERSWALLTLAVANLSSVATMSSLAALLGYCCPRRAAVTQVVLLRAMFSALGASLLTACVAGAVMP